MNKIYNSRELKQEFSKKLNFGVIGGSFNPVHFGHIGIANNAAIEYNFDCIILLVAYQNPFKPKYEVSFENRVSLLSEAIIDYDKLIISTTEKEIDNFETFNSMQYLEEILPNGKFTWIMGEDNIEHFLKWKNYHLIIEKYDTIIFGREYSNKSITRDEFINKINEIDNSLVKKVKFNDNNKYDISSSEIRLKSKLNHLK